MLTKHQKTESPHDNATCNMVSHRPEGAFLPHLNAHRQYLLLPRFSIVISIGIVFYCGPRREGAGDRVAFCTRPDNKTHPSVGSWAGPSSAAVVKFGDSKAIQQRFVALWCGWSCAWDQKPGAADLPCEIPGLRHGGRDVGPSAPTARSYRSSLG